MPDWIRAHSQDLIVKLLLAMIVVPFALFGISSYFEHRSDHGVASVDGEVITTTEFQHALKQQHMTQGVDNDQLQRAVLDALIRQHAMLAEAKRVGMVVSDRQLADFIAMIPAFQDKGKFNLQHYQEILRRQDLTVPKFEKMARQELLIQDLRAPFEDAHPYSQTSLQLFEQAYGQQREVSAVTFPVSGVATSIVITPAQVNAYYHQHAADFALPPRAQFQYVVLSLDAFARNLPVDSAAIQQYYTQNKAQYLQPEQRQASHILIAVTPADNAQKHAQAKALADKLYQQVTQHPDRFAALAKQYSSDTGSAAQGGDLGWFGREAMVKSFSDAAFSLKPGQISSPILTNYGYHIIQLKGIRPAKERSLAEVSPEITLLLQKQQASSRFADAVDRFTNQVFEQPNNLSAIAQRLNLPLQTSAWMTHAGGDTAVLNSPKLLQDLFSDDVLKNHHNTEVVEVSPNTMVAARLLSYQPASQQSLSAVSAQIISLLRTQQARLQVAQHGEAMLAQLRAGKEPAGLRWGNFTWISRTNPGVITSTHLLTKVFSVDDHALPAYVGGQDSQGNFQLVRVTRVVPVAAADAAKFQALGGQVARMQADQAFKDYINMLVAKAKIQVNQSALSKAVQ